MCRAWGGRSIFAEADGRIAVRAPGIRYSAGHDVFTLFRVAAFQTVWGCVKYLPSPIGDVLRYLVLKSCARQVSTFWIRSGVTIWWPSRIAIGRSSINEDVHLNGFGGINIGDNVMIGHRCSLVSDEHVFDRTDIPISEQGRAPRPIEIGDDVYLGCNVTVLPGTCIGKGAVIGAGSVVKGDIPPGMVAAGVPARLIRQRGTT